MHITVKSFAQKHYVMIGTLCAFLGAVGFSVKSVLIKLAYLQAIDAVSLLVLRMMFSLPFFLFIVAWSAYRKNPAPIATRDRWAITVLGLLGYYLASLLDFMGLTYISASLERLVLFLYPTLVVILAAVFLRKPIRTSTVVALALSYIGVAMAITQDVEPLSGPVVIGTALVFGSMVSYALYLVGSGEVLARVGAMRFTGLAMTVSCVAALIHFGLTHRLAELAQPMNVYGVALIMAIFSTVLPSILVSVAIRRIGAGAAAMIGSIGPIITIALATMLLNESMTLLQLIGGGLVIGGVLVVSLQAKPA